MAKTMAKSDALRTLPRLEKKLNEALAALGHPARIAVVISPDKSDPLNQRVIIGVKAVGDYVAAGS